MFLSYTNPANPTAIQRVVELVQGDHPDWPAHHQDGARPSAPPALITVTGQIETVPQNDPDSLKMAPNGDLILSSGDDGAIIDIHDPGTAHQSVSFTPVAGVTVGHAGLDDVIKPDATSGTFTLTDTATNTVYSFHASGLNPNDYYASVGSLKAFGQVDPTTGAFTPLLSADNAPGFNFCSPTASASSPIPRRRSPTRWQARSDGIAHGTRRRCSATPSRRRSRRRRRRWRQQSSPMRMPRTRYWPIPPVTPDRSSGTRAGLRAGTAISRISAGPGGHELPAAHGAEEPMHDVTTKPVDPVTRRAGDADALSGRRGGAGSNRASLRRVPDWHSPKCFAARRISD